MGALFPTFWKIATKWLVERMSIIRCNGGSATIFQAHSRRFCTHIAVLAKMKTIIFCPHNFSSGVLKPLGKQPHSCHITFRESGENDCLREPGGLLNVLVNAPKCEQVLPSIMSTGEKAV